MGWGFRSGLELGLVGVCRRLEGSALLCIGRGLWRRAGMGQLVDVNNGRTIYLERLPVETQTFALSSLIFSLHGLLVVL
jgi:hypothetical protein